MNMKWEREVRDDERGQRELTDRVEAETEVVKMEKWGWGSGFPRLLIFHWVTSFTGPLVRILVNLYWLLSLGKPVNLSGV